jgi:peptide/nickel transport system substrate-binding protein
MLAGVAQAQRADIAASGLVHPPEGAAVVTDPARIPARFQEAPMLAERVRAGTLPPVEQRLPQEPLVLQPLQEIGRYGGTWRRGFTGPGDGENGNRINASDMMMQWDMVGARQVPSVARAGEVSADGRRTTLHLRRGMRWSDGAPFTADDFVFWFEELYQDREITRVPMPEMQIEGRPGRVVKIDEVTVAFEFDSPNFLVVEQLAAQAGLGGQSYRQSGGITYGGYAPAHYLRRFLPRHSSVEEVTRRARAAGFESWTAHLHFAKDWQLNPELPTLGPWRTVRPINTPTWVMERNPYYWMVDTAGNQLPYIDRVVMTLAENLEVVTLRAIAGEYDQQARHLQLAALPVLLQNRDRGGYRIDIDLATYGADLALHLNTSYVADLEIGKWLRNVEFRRALSLGIDRDQLNETFWLGLGTPGSVVVAESSPENPGPEWRRRWATHDPAEANRMLDRIGLARRDSQGFRLRTDNGQRLVLEVLAVPGLQPYPRQLEMVAQQMRRIGIFLDVKETERTLAFTRVTNNQHQVFPWSNSGSEKLFLVPAYVLPVDPIGSANGPAYAQWFASGGQRGIEPTDPLIRRAQQLYASAPGLPEAERNRVAQEIWKIAVDQVWSIGVVGVSPGSFGVRLVSNRLGNVPRRFCVANHCRTPSGAYPQQWFFR